MGTQPWRDVNPNNYPEQLKGLLTVMQNLKPPIAFVSRLSDGETATWLRALSDVLPDETILAVEQIEDRKSVEIAVLADPKPADLLQLPNLRWAQSLWAGVENILAEPLLAQLPVVRLSDPNLAATMAEAVLAWTLYLHRDMPAYAQSRARREWHPLPVVPASKRHIGILGLGTLGQRAAQTLRDNGFSVSGWARTEKKLPGIACYHGQSGLTNMLAGTDILVGLLPHTIQTENLLDQHTLATLKNEACLINFGRGTLLDDIALIDALDSGRLRHAVLDVFRTEPLPAGDAFWSHPRVTVLPHISAPTDPLTASAIVAQNIGDYRQDGLIPATVDPARGY